MKWNRAFSLGSLVLQMGLSFHPAQAASLSEVNEICPAQLGDAIAQLTDGPQLRQVRWGILIQTIGDAQTLYAKNATGRFIPASNAKLLTTAAALTQLTPSFRFRTSVYQTSLPGEPISLWVVGRGDPSLTETELHQLAQQLRDRGITEVDQLILDDQYFRGAPVHPSWEAEDIQQGYGAPANSLILNQNALNLTLVPRRLGEPLQVIWENPNDRQGWQIDNRSQTAAADAPEFVEVGRDFSRPIVWVKGQLRVGSVPEPVAISVPQPVQHFGDRFQQVLAVEGIQIRQKLTADDPLPANAIEIAAVESAPLVDLLRKTNQESNNLYAEVLLRALGSAYLPNTSDSRAAGLEATQAILTNLGIATDNYSLLDGSGLSRQNWVSPLVLVQTLRGMAHSSDAETYSRSLAVAGTSGTLENRFQASAVRGHLQGKSGYMGGVAALSGYLQPPDFLPLGFSILVNQPRQSVVQVEQVIDQIVETLFNLQPC